MYGFRDAEQPYNNNNNNHNILFCVCTGVQRVWRCYITLKCKEFRAQHLEYEKCHSKQNVMECIFIFLRNNNSENYVFGRRII